MLSTASLGLAPYATNETRQQDDEYDKNGKRKSKDLPDYLDDTYFTERVQIPDRESYAFSWRKLWAYCGPGFLMSIAFLDPGNIESDLEAGTQTHYELLWVLMWSTGLGLLVQILAARAGVVTGYHMAELVYRRYPKVPRILLWLMTEAAIIGSDMQEVIGTAVAFYLVSLTKIPIWAGVLITVVDTFTFLFLDRYGLRKLEAFFAFLIGTMAITFGYEFFKQGADYGQIGLGLVIPKVDSFGGQGPLQAIGIIGACIMPHNLYLHSALVKSREVDRTNRAEVKDANRYILIESAIALFISFIINIFVISVFAEGLFGKQSMDINGMCANSSIWFSDGVFPNTTDTADVDMYSAGIYLGCAFGLGPLIIWAIGLYAAGQSSTMTGTYAGQFCMEGFLHLTWPRWKRVLVTRSIAIVPTLAVAASSGSLEKLTAMNNVLNAFMSIQLPWALLPALTFSASHRVMGHFKNNIWTNIAAAITSYGIIGINCYFVQGFLSDNTSMDGWIIFLEVIFYVAYIAFILYLTGCYLVALGWKKVASIPYIGTYMDESPVTEFHHFYEETSIDTVNLNTDAGNASRNTVSTLVP